MDLFAIDLDLWVEYIVKISVAFLLALPVAWDRERNTRIMGLRTFPLVAVGTCAFILVTESFIPSDAPDAKARIVQGLLGGIGFIGGGAILKDKDRVLGTASAASIWIMGALGAAVAYGNLEVAITLAVADLLVLTGLRKFKTSDEDVVEDDG